MDTSMERKSKLRICAVHQSAGAKGGGGIMPTKFWSRWGEMPIRPENSSLTRKHSSRFSQAARIFGKIAIFASTGPILALPLPKTWPAGLERPDRHAKGPEPDRERSSRAKMLTDRVRLPMREFAESIARRGVDIPPLGPLAAVPRDRWLPWRLPARRCMPGCASFLGPGAHGRGLDRHPRPRPGSRRA